MDIFLLSAHFLQNNFFSQKIPLVTLSECQTVWFRIKQNILSVMIWVLTVCKGYQKTTLKGKELTFVKLNIFYAVTLPNCYTVNLQHSSCKHIFPIRVENSVDPVQMASSEASLSGSTVFSKKE